MQRRLKWVFVFSTFILGTVAYVGNVLATPASGFTGTTLAVGRFGDIHVANHVLPDGFSRSNEENLSLSWQKTTGPSDLYVQSNVWTPGGTTGWHTHAGHSLIIVMAGAVTAYESDDPSCTPHIDTAGMGFVDPGGEHVHLLRNEGSIEARTIAVQLIPAGAMRRIDAENSASCPF